MDGINFFTFAPILAGLLTGIIGIVFIKKDAAGEDVDKGFSKNYFRLPYRKRMIINLVAYPLIIVTFFIIYLSFDLSPLLSLIASLILLISFFTELIYNYKRWKKYERKG
ncbi:hypothetical protein [Gracilibacillus timonensis]|uniref:hypothetical protein n=1 Tax=Gracilibacillus timonensis TaxID=1816696 RepID=UPI000826D298|nr:hypothetical protein [Gracilibacillus timonensis]